MTSFSYMFLGVAVVSAIVGFGDSAGASAQVARVMAVTFGLIFVANIIIQHRNQQQR